MSRGRSLAAASLLFVAGANADERFSVGVGVGALYAGLGANVALASASDFKFLALGCVARYENGDGSSGNACGVGIGWLRTDWIPSDSHKHALGVYVGPVSARLSANNIDTVYGVGVNYSYFFSGVDHRGFLVGLMPALSRESGETKGYLLLNVGYQF